MHCNPQLSVLIPWCDRPEIRTTLTQNAPILRQFDSEILVLNCGGDAEQLKTLLYDSGSPTLPETRITDLGRPQFNKSYALNIGAYLSRSSRIFVLDADILLNIEVVKGALTILERSAFVTVEKVFESQPTELFGRGTSKHKPLSVVTTYFVDISLADGTSISVRTFRKEEMEGIRGGAGLIFVRRDHLIQVDGYNSDLQHWGWEDNDMRVRLKRVLDLEHCEVGSVFHLSHPDSARALFGKSRESAVRSNLATVCERYAEGNFRGTYSSDVEAWLSRE
jgi:hypothetical protein